MILPRLFPKPRIKALSGKRRNWAKSNKFYLTGHNRITADLLIRHLMRVDYEIGKTAALVRSHKVGKSALKRLINLRKAFFLMYLEATSLPFDVKTEPIGDVKCEGVN